MRFFSDKNKYSRLFGHTVCGRCRWSDQPAFSRESPGDGAYVYGEAHGIYIIIISAIISAHARSSDIEQRVLVGIGRRRC